MKSRLLLLTFVALTPFSAYADAKSEIKANYDKIIAAMKKRDEKVMMSMLTKDFVFVAQGNKLTRTQFEQQLKMQLGLKLNIDSITMSFSSFSASGNKATTSYVTQMKARFPKSKSTGKESKLDTKVTAKDTWIKSGKVWLIQKMESVKDDTKIDGKPFTGH